MLAEGRYAAGAETQETALWSKRDLPWDHLAFEHVRGALQDFTLQRGQPVYASPVQDLVWMPPCTPVKPAARGTARTAQPVLRGLRAAPRGAPLAAARSAST